jgi:hypothetical protein
MFHLRERSQTSEMNHTCTEPFRDREWTRITDAITATGLGRSKLYKMIRGSEVRSKVVGRVRLISVPSLLAYIDPESAAEPKIRRRVRCSERDDAQDQ